MVELAVLERLCTGNRTEGSNPSSSARRGSLKQSLGVSLLEEIGFDPGFDHKVHAQKLA